MTADVCTCEACPVHARPPTIPSVWLTEKQRETLLFLVTFLREHRVPPTTRQMAAAAGVKGQAITDRLEQLERKGLVVRGVARRGWLPA